MRFKRAKSPDKTYSYQHSTALRAGLEQHFQRTQDKTILPLLLLETAGNKSASRHLICLDFDDLSNKVGVCLTPEEIIERIGESHPAMAVSPSGNGLKVFITIQGDLPRCAEDNRRLRQEVKDQFIDRKAAEDKTWGRLWTRIEGAWDDAVVALTRCFATEEIGRAALLGVSEVAHVVRYGVASNVESRSIVSNLNTDSSAHRFNPLEDNTPTPANLKEFVGIGTEARGREALIRILLNLRKLQTAFDLPQRKLAEELGVSVSVINKWLKELQARGWLRILDHSYTPGVKAKTYKATSSLLYAMQQLRPTTRIKKSLPICVEDGRFYRQALGALNYFESEDSFMKWVEGLSGITDKRIKEARRYARGHFRRIATSGSSAVRA
jgi:transcriptional regulator with XRE-family HTH domain